MGNRDRLLKEFYPDMHRTVCAQCGMRFCRGESTLVVSVTEDIIHDSCYDDYMSDNKDTFVKALNC